MKRVAYILALLMMATTAMAQNKPTADEVRKDRARNIRLPHDNGFYLAVKDYIEDVPDDDYIHAPEQAYEAFRDIKFSIRIHWGVYSKWGIEASWPFLNMDNARRQEYQNLYKTFNPTSFDAQEWMDFFKRCGMQAFAFTTKHHDGFSMFHTDTKVTQRANYWDTAHIIEPCNLHYSIEETPFKRDIVKELCDAAHRNNIKIDLYFSHPDWYDADFRPYAYHPLWKIPKTQVETDRMMARHREQVRELLTNYGKVDMMCFDMTLGADVWPQLKQTVKMMRQIQPELMIRVRGIGNYGDYFQPEQWVPAGMEKTGMPWMSICLLGKIFAYDPVAEHYKGSPWVIKNLIDCVAKGGSFMVCLGPDEFGHFHPTAVKQLEEVGDWLKVNGKGIYETRAYDVWRENNTYFTRSKDNKRVYAFVDYWPGTELTIKSVTPKKGSKLYMFGYDKPLKWTSTPQGVRITIPEALQKEENRPCKTAWGFEIVNSD